MSLSISMPAFRHHRIAVSVFFFVAGLTFSSWAARIPDIKNTLHLSDAALGSVLFALPVGLMASLPLSGWLVAKWGSRLGVLTGAIMYPLTLLAIAGASEILELAAALFFFGLWSNLLNISVNTQAVGVENLYGRSIMASFHGVWSLAGFTGAAIGGVVVSAGVSLLVHYSIICAVCLLLTMMFFKDTISADGGGGNQPLFARPDKGLLLLGLIAFGSLVCEGTMFDWSGVYFDKIIGAPKHLITVGYVAFMSTMAGGRFISDRLTTKIGKNKVLQISGVLIAAGLMISVLIPHVFTATLGFLLVGFGVSSVVPLVYSAAGKTTTMAPGAALAAVSTIGFVGFLAGPPTIGFIAEAASLRWSFSLIACIGIMIAVLASVVRIK